MSKILCPNCKDKSIKRPVLPDIPIMYQRTINLEWDDNGSDFIEHLQCKICKDQITVFYKGQIVKGYVTNYTSIQ